MAADANLYKTVACLDAYSFSGSFDDPIFQYPPNYFQGGDGEAKDVQLWIRNDGDTKLINVAIAPVDLLGDSEITWIKLANNQGNLGGATPGVSYEVADLNPTNIQTFWMRLTVPVATPEQDKRDLCLQIQADSIVI